MNAITKHLLDKVHWFSPDKVATCWFAGTSPRRKKNNICPVIDSLETREHKQHNLAGRRMIAAHGSNRPKGNNPDWPQLSATSKITIVLLA